MQSKLETRNSQLATRNFPPGFTLTELLVVLGIIIFLIGILMPVVSRVRRAAYIADTESEISQLSNACNQYYSSFHAFPGPFSNDDTANGKIGAPNGAATLTQLYFNGQYGSLTTNTTYGPTSTTWTVTGAENLVLGLMGGLRPISPATNPPTVAFAPQEVGLGPMSLNPINPTRTPSFFSTGSNYLMWCQANGRGPNSQTIGAYQNLSGSSTFMGTAFTDPAGTSAGDCPIPVFVDRFPSPGPLPILYLRARTGAKGVVWDNTTVTADPNGNVPYYQYDLRDITPYTHTHIGLPPSNQWGTAVTHNLVGIESPFSSGNVTSASAMNLPKPGNPLQNADLYFTNPSIPPTGSDPNYTGRPRAVDQFILISAGPDGIYGTADDITSFGDVSQ